MEADEIANSGGAAGGTAPHPSIPPPRRCLERLMSNGARTILVESPDRFARDLMVQLSSPGTTCSRRRGSASLRRLPRRSSSKTSRLRSRRFDDRVRQVRAERSIDAVSLARMKAPATTGSNCGGRSAPTQLGSAATVEFSFGPVKATIESRAALLIPSPTFLRSSRPTANGSCLC